MPDAQLKSMQFGVMQRAIFERDDDMSKRLIVGDPDEVAAEMLRDNDLLGVNHIILSMQGIGVPQAQVLDTFQLMAEEVFPKVCAAL